MLFIVLALFVVHSTSVCSINCEEDTLTCGGYCDYDTKTCQGGNRCTNTLTPYCHSNRCVECAEDLQCNYGSYRKCDRYNDKCVECITSFDCNFDSLRTKCDTDRKECQECTNDYHCSSDQNCGSYCDNGRCSFGENCSAQEKKCDRDPVNYYQDTYRCVDCTANSHCGGSTPFCDPYSNTCVECVSDNHCRITSNCNAVCSSNKCLDSSLTPLNCLNTPETPNCDIYKGLCVSCRTDRDCHDIENPRCSLDDGKCHFCASDEHCRNDNDCTATCEHIIINGSEVFRCLLH